MDKRNEQAKQFGRILEEGHQNLDANAPENPDLKNAVVSFAAIHSPSRMNKRLVVGGTVSVVIAAAAAVLLLLLPDLGATPLRFYIDSAGQPSEVGSWIRTDHAQNRAVRFADGSHINVLPQTETRIAAADSKHVTVDLNHGSLRLKVTPKRSNHWTVRAGPYQVEVVGTRFHVKWQSDNSRLFVQVTKGRVAIRGPGIDTNGIFVAAGNLLRAEGQRQFVSVEPAPQWRAETSENRSEEVRSEATEATRSNAVDPQIAPSQPSNDKNFKKATASKSWQQLAKANAYEPALRAARNIGLQSLAKTLPAQELWLLATTARYCGAFNDAAALFFAHRQRFPANKKSRTAAYLLGELSLNQKSDAAQAKRWFTAYISEAPHGALHEEALGRLMILSIQSGQNIEARRHATDYLQRYPSGLYSEQAGSILNR